MKVIGVDPGLTGGVAMYCGGTFKDVELIVAPIPIHRAISGRGNDVSAAELVDTYDVLFSDADHAFIERVGAMPQEGASSSFKFGYVAGLMYGIIAAHRVPITMVNPQKWKAIMGLGKHKNVAVARACELFPHHVSFFKGPKGGDRDGPAEAALIAKYGYDSFFRQKEPD